MEGDLRESAIWLPAIRMDDAFVRRIGGEVYAIANKAPLQYWQTLDYRMLSGEDWDEPVEPVEPASVAEIMEVIRKLGYPV
jgi:hypothetical protein